MKPIYRCLDEERFVENPNDCLQGATILMSGQQRLQLSKLISGLLRHFPHEADLVPDREGWIPIKDLVKGIKEKWRNKESYAWVTEEHVKAIALLDPKGRFQIKEGKIRATYGHSYPVEVKYDEDQKSTHLFHGTPSRNISRILKEGLKPGKRLWVHLTTDRSLAVETGRRYSREVALLHIDVNCLRARGIKVYKAAEDVRLVKYVPVECIKKYEVIGKV